MAYSNNPNLLKARKQALREVVEDKIPIEVVARRSSVHRITIWRWLKKWKIINWRVQLTNFNRPTRSAGSVFRLSGVNWNIPTLSSAPKTHPQRISKQIVGRVISLKQTTQRCAEVICYKLLEEGVCVSVSTSSASFVGKTYKCNASGTDTTAPYQDRTLCVQVISYRPTPSTTLTS